MFKWFFHILIFATNKVGSGKYQNNEKPLKRQRNLGLIHIVYNYSTQHPHILEVGV